MNETAARILLAVKIASVALLAAVVIERLDLSPVPTGAVIVMAWIGIVFLRQS